MEKDTNLFTIILLIVIALFTLVNTAILLMPRKIEANGEGDEFVKLAMPEKSTETEESEA